MRKDADPKYLTVSCPTCHARKGEICGYAVTKEQWIWDFSSRSHHKDIVHLKGTPLKDGRVHQDRQSKYWNLQYREERLRLQRQKLSVVQAINQHEAREYEQLRNWLINNARHLFWKAP